MPEQIQQTIDQIVKILLEKYKPEQVILFGSLASNTGHEDSDIDLLIVKETLESPLDRRVFVRRLVNNPARRVPFSPLVITPGELANQLALGDPFYREIIQTGKVLYART